MDTKQPLTNSERSKRYRKSHPDRVNEQNRTYYNNNIDKMREYQRTYRADHKETITCPCGATVQKRCISNHRKTQKHIRLTTNMQANPLNDPKYIKLRANALINLKKHYKASLTITDKKQNKNKWRTIYKIIQKYAIAVNEFRHIRDDVCDPLHPCNQCRPINNDNDDDDI